MRQHVLLSLALSGALGQDKFYEPNAAIAPFPSASCNDITFKDGCSCAEEITGMIVVVDNGTCAAGDTVNGPPAADLAAVGIDGVYIKEDCLYEFKGTGTISQYLTFLAQVTFETMAMDLQPREVRYSLGHAFFGENEHLYEWHDFSEVNLYPGHDDKSWSDAQYFCAHPDQDIFGMIGYLATITSQEENDIIMRYHIFHGGQGYIGATDVHKEGDWRWVVGPEGCPSTYETAKDAPPFRRSACDIGDQGRSNPGVCTGSECGEGLHFWDGGDYIEGMPDGCDPPTPNCGRPVGGAYHHWRPGAPDNKKKDTNDNKGDHFMTTQNDLLWNDLPQRHNSEVKGFVCEFGEVGELCIGEGDLAGKQRLVHELNECEATCATCENGACDDFMQMCNDPTMTARMAELSDWTCTCASPKKGTATAMTATCELDECVDGEGKACTDAGQMCNDPAKSDGSLMDFVCTCPAQQTGMAEGEVATCELDECTTAGKACTDEGQMCNDPNKDPAVANDFVCECASPQTGMATGMVAPCVLDECTDGAGKTDCGGADQLCMDMDTAADSRSDYVCTCKAPLQGEAKGMAASCTRDECVDGDGKMCTDQNQNCVDMDKDAAKLGDFRCTCKDPEMGEADGGVATCTLDECHDGSALKMTCEMANQICVDPDANKRNDAFCKCKPPSMETNVGAAVASCDYDECMDFAATCHNAAQECEDPNKAAPMDWICKCISPQYTDPANTHGQQAAAVCLTPPGDCAEAGKVCTDNGQTCDPGADGYDGQFECGCTAPATGTPGSSMLATCELDECTTSCPNCNKNDANPTGICESNEQECNDPDKTPGKENDWVCSCFSPYMGSAVRQAAQCTINECRSTNGCSHCAGTTCSDASQTCADPDTAVKNDWKCVCKAPQTGEEVGKAAVCELDECKQNQATCVGQTCEDPDMSATSTDDWECVCDSGERATAMAAMCSEDECESTTVCTQGEQKCVDKDLYKKNTWVCECNSPAQGEQVGALAVCKLDECVIQCSSCADSGAGDVCAAAGQRCIEPDDSATSTDDWICECQPPQGRATAVGRAVAQCPDLDECVDESKAAISGLHIPRYTNEGGCHCWSGWTIQCADPSDCDYSGPGFTEPCVEACCNPDDDPKGLWCFVRQDDYNSNKDGCNPESNPNFDDWDSMWGHCMPKGSFPSDGGLPRPYNRQSITGVSDEQTNVCTDKGQKCVDPSPMTDDWWCECASPYTGEQSVGAPVEMCEYDECNDNGATCTGANPPQTCNDPNKAITSIDDWECVCTVGPALTATAAQVASCELDECSEQCSTCAYDGTTTICTQAEQNCVDPDTSSGSTGDWECRCPSPGTGANRGGAATCAVDECAAVCNTCMKKSMNDPDICQQAEQVCKDPDTSPGALGNWVCKCLAPSKTEATISVATCEIDECRTDSRVNCTVNEQKCVDPDLTKKDDWFCECYKPYTQSQVTGVAKCEIDECSTNGQVCVNVGQRCVDKDLAKMDTWYCQCIAPDEMGDDAERAPATCTQTEECQDNPVCPNAGQHCHDEPGDMNWVCQCIEPYRGDDATMMPADCRLDECAEACTTCQRLTTSDEKVCERNGQTCEDPDDKVSSNWVCKCKAPATGTDGQQAAAVCALDECAADCPTCEKGACSMASPMQTCEDVDMAATAVNTWVCKCPPPSTNQATGKPAPTCTRNECDDNTPKVTCAMEEQECVDPDPLMEGDWECRCLAPAAGKKVGAPAEGCKVVNECLVRCRTCADTGDGNVCTNAGQTCTDPDTSVFSNWVCECARPATGVKEGGPVATANCVLDECEAQCDTCADKGSGRNICTMEEQVCVEGVKTQGSKSDWKCVCPEPLAFVSATAAVARCSFDECKDVHPDETAPRGKVCADAGQNCQDASLTLPNDYVCSCPTPQKGSKTAGAATCTLNECDILKNNQTCAQAGQRCTDPDATMSGNWQCVCPTPSTTTATAKAATCEVDECTDPANSMVCEGANQDCIDPNRANTGDWRCVCRAPSTGAAVTGAAFCLLDECEADCATCERNACGLKGQDCTDSNQGASQTGDWMCMCRAPASGSATGRAVENCVVDECKTKGRACIEVEQACVDPSDALGDWQCICPAPSTGTATAAAAMCERDECSETTVCSQAGQQCTDPNKDAGSLDDWVCNCIPPAKEDAPGMQAEAMCSYTGECEDAVNSEVCTSVGQRCVDPNPTTPNDWRCECLAPAQGPSATMSQASCTIDECAVSCSHCAGTTCQNANQQCIDNDQRATPAGIRNWQCRCIAPKTGSATAAAAKCSSNECDDYGATCIANEQICTDPDPNVAGDWVCSCPYPKTGSATMAAATCLIDECFDNAGTCSQAGQECFDPDKSEDSRGDWECSCPAPSTNKATARAATCDVDECNLYGATCIAEEQDCIDEDKTKDGSWFCVCLAPATGKEAAKAAMCIINECEDAAPGSAVQQAGMQDVCTAGGQTCTDPDTRDRSRGDWSCTCAAPSTSTAVGQLATCTDNECQDATKGGQCTGAEQECVDPDWTVPNNWYCRCLAPAEGTGQQMVAMCAVDECAFHDICTNAGQLCNDPNPLNTDDWVCSCPPASGATGMAVAKPADCKPPPGSECQVDSINRICTDAGQLCNDPDFNVDNNWECQCVEPAQPGKQTMGPAACVLDECTAVCSGCGTNVCPDDQDCIDPRKTANSRNDWSCVCKAPQSGSRVAQPATCLLDECVVQCPTCANKGAGNVCTTNNQICRDSNPDARSLSDWTCQCKAPADGIATTKPATCIFDECDSAGRVCAAEEQACIDANTAPESTGDWTCSCRFPGVGSRVGAVATCVVDECNMKENADVCTNAGQRCVDPNKSASQLNDWECRCTTGTSSAVMMAATCSLNECTDRCQTCADTGTGNICTANEQDCVDPTDDVTATGDWMCICPGPQGSPRATASVAKCGLDECTQLSNYGARTCEHARSKDVNGCVCKCNWQMPDLASAYGPGKDSPCKSGCCNPDNKAGGNWCEIDAAHPDNAGKPQCSAPAEPWSFCAPADAASFVDIKNVCTEAGQECIDNYQTTTSILDWQCRCVPPQMGATITAGVATCALDECTADCQTCEKDTCTMAAPPQVCEDPSDATGDWVCKCPPGTMGTDGKQAQAASCMYPGENECSKTEYASVCTDAGQLCTDPDTTVNGDWICSCVPPARGASRRQGPASCQLDECTASCGTCAGSTCIASEQLCEDQSLSPTDLSDWVCKCPPPTSGQQRAGVAVCGQDECEINGGANALICAQSGQTCRDADLTITGSWTCTCVAPLSGTATARPADCKLDECEDEANDKACRDAGQQCTDPTLRASSRNDWTCTCVDASGRTQSKVMGPATCEVTGWCEANGNLCTAAGQQCIPAADASGTGSCRCIAPQKGADKVGGAASCELDECEAACPTCSMSTCVREEQTCNDPNKSPMSLLDWTCQCPMSMAKAVARPASCDANECIVEGDACRAEEQDCVDPDVTMTGDWYCVCPPPRTGRRTTGAADCEIDECVINEGVCTSNAQICIDSNRKANNDWKCMCIAPAVGSATAAAAECMYAETDECKDETNRKVCTDLGQACVDPSDAMNNWECRCVAPQTGAPGMQAAAMCRLDECIAICATCAQQQGQPVNLCSQAGQQCVDPTTDPSQRSDWFCLCNAPSSGQAITAVAMCGQNECDEPIHSSTCLAEKDSDGNSIQECVDPDTSVAGDWECRCKLPYTGMPAKMAAARCGIDECIAADGDRICIGEEQTCTDPGLGATQLGDWYCTCPYTGEIKVQGPVTPCTPPPGLCRDNGAVCTDAGQSCVERGEAWYCVCVEPSVGEAPQAAVQTCELNECVTTCDTCAQKLTSHVCVDFGQMCFDPNPTADMRSDWECRCTEGAGVAIASTAMCPVDECERETLIGTMNVKNGDICTASAQTCVDPSDALGDWVCRCRPPQTGEGLQGPAACKLDECIEKGVQCMGQECLDVNQAPDSTGDWFCKCGEGASGTAQAMPAVCEFTYGGCAVESNRMLCENAGQLCVPSTTDPNDFRCACVAPARGTPVSMGPATCELDECVEACLTCAKASVDQANVCTLEEQECFDSDKSTTALSNWVCRCPSGSSEMLLAPVPYCGLDECEAGQPARMTCDGADQLCVDLDYRPEALNTWFCICKFDATRRAPLRPVDSCGANECLVTPDNTATCARSGQQCVDPDTTVTDDWGCKCIGADGFNMGGPVDMCIYPEGNECEANGAVCQAAEQLCEDPNLAVTDDWKCVCLSPSYGEATAMAAVCELDECTTPLTRCAFCAGQACGFDQDCVDPNKSPESAGDWTCNCRAPLSGSAMLERADCGVVVVPTLPPTPPTPSPPVPPGGINECLINGNAAVCTAGSHCEDINQLEGNNWECVCDVAGQGVAVMRPVVCGTDECLTESNRKACEDARPPQQCRDLNPQSTGDWQCFCTISDGSQVFGIAKPADGCEYVGECADEANHRVCEEAEQICVDPSLDSTGDWECHCPGGKLGAPGQQAAAPSCGPDECAEADCLYNEACPWKVCHDAGQVCRDDATDYSVLYNWQCFCQPPQGASAIVSVVEDCTIMETPTPFNTSGAASGEDDDCGGFFECFWWILLLLLCCCCLLLLLFFLLRMRKTNSDQDEHKWNKQFQATSNDLDDMKELKNEEGETEDPTAAASEMSLLANEHASPSRNPTADSDELEL